MRIRENILQMLGSIKVICIGAASIELEDLELLLTVLNCFLNMG